MYALSTRVGTRTCTSTWVHVYVYRYSYNSYCNTKVPGTGTGKKPVRDAVPAAGCAPAVLHCAAVCYKTNKTTPVRTRPCWFKKKLQRSGAHVRPGVNRRDERDAVSSCPHRLSQKRAVVSRRCACIKRSATRRCCVVFSAGIPRVRVCLNAFVFAKMFRSWFQ